MAEISAYGMLNLKGGATFSAEGFPSNPKNGQFAFDSGVFYIYATIGGTTTWYPLSNKKESHIHTQAVASAVWTVEHGMGSQDFGYFAYDENHSLMMANVANVTDSTFEIHFTSPVAGTAVCFFETELFVPQLSADGVIVDTLTATTAIIGGVNIVELANSNQADLITLMGEGAGSLAAGVVDAKSFAQDLVDTEATARGTLAGRVDNVENIMSTDEERMAAVTTLLELIDSEDQDILAQLNTLGNDTYRKSEVDTAIEDAKPVLSELPTVVVADAGTVSYSATYNPDFVMLYLNRQKLRAGEFTATTGTAYTLNVPLEVGDELDLVTTA